MKQFKVTFTDYGVSVDVDEASTLMDAASRANLSLQADCGCKGSCGKCEALITFDSKSRTSEKVLMCQKKVLADVHVEILSPSVSSLTGEFSVPFRNTCSDTNNEIHPFFETKTIQLKIPELNDARSDLRRVMDAIPEVKNINISGKTLKELPQLLRESGFRVNVLTCEGNLCNISSPDGFYSVAFDIGTSSICARLMDLRSGNILSSSVCANPQRIYGSDVSSRCSYISGSEARLKVLNKLVVEKCDRMISWMCEQSGISSNLITCAAVSGNTIMLHIFTGVDPTSIGEAPYTQVFNNSVRTFGETLGITSIPAATVVTLPCVSGYIGADAVAGAVRMDITRSEKPVLLVDLGTNAEIILKAKDMIYACAAAAGPSIEGAHMSCGATASPGAVSAVSISDSVEYTVIGDEAPSGICGTGILDSISELLRIGVIKKNGRIAPEDNNVLPSICERILLDGMKKSFVIVPPLEAKNHRAIVITQSDVRAFQMGKSAVRTGIDALLEVAGISVDDLGRIYLAGALGDNINPKSAINAGIIPDIPLEKIQSIGNSALDGTVECLLYKEKMREASEIASRIHYIELSSMDGFMDKYVGNMPFTSVFRV